MKHAKLRYWMNPDPNKRLDTSAFGNCGYLMKRGQNIKNWCRRWFVCRDEYLLYFKSPKVCSCLQLQGTRAIERVSKRTNERYQPIFSPHPK